MPLRLSVARVEHVYELAVRVAVIRRDADGHGVGHAVELIDELELWHGAETPSWTATTTATASARSLTGTPSSTASTTAAATATTVSWGGFWAYSTEYEYMPCSDVCFSLGATCDPNGGGSPWPASNAALQSLATSVGAICLSVSEDTTCSTPGACPSLATPPAHAVA